MTKERFPDSAMRTLFAAILALETEAECQAFFTDLCTMSELKSLSQRLMVAALLRQQRTYGEITETTGVSAATISRVSRAMNYGEEGYQLILDRLVGCEVEKDAEIK